MSEDIQAAPTPSAAPILIPASANPSVAHCCEAYLHAYKAAKAKGKGKVFTELDAELAYRSAMPPLTGCGNIQDFIACTAHGMLIGSITGPDGARLLYAAQVAHGALRSPSTK